MKNKLIILFVTCVLELVVCSNSAYAQNATDSADALRDSVKAKVTQELAQIKQAVAKKGFVGMITAKSDASLTISNYKNQPRSLTVTPDTTVKLANGAEGLPAALKVGDSVLAMGNVDSQNVMTTTRLLVIAKPEPLTRKAIFGSVSKISTTSLSVDNWTVRLSSVTEYFGKAKATDVKIGNQVIIQGTVTGSTAMSALRIYLVTPIPTPKPQ